MKIRTKLLLVTLAISLIPAMIIGFFSVFQSRDALKNEVFNHLESVREIKKAQLEALFAKHRGDMHVLLDMVTSFKQLMSKKVQSVQINQLEELLTSKLIDGQKDFFSSYIHQHDYYDLFLIYPSGQIFYTVKHELDYSTNILTDQYANSGLGQLILKVLQTKTFSMSDFALYAPSFNKPAAFIAQPLLYNNGTIELIVVLQLSGTVINKIMQERAGMSNMGETYLIGEDKLMRSTSYLDPAHYSLSASFANPIKGTINTEASNNALSGETGKKIIKNYRDIFVLSAYTPINVGNTTWAIIAEIPAAEIFQPIKQLEWFLFMSTLLISLIILIFLSLFTKRLTIPLLQVNQHLKTLAQGRMLEKDIDYPMKDEIGELVISVCTLQKGIKNTIAQANAIAAGDYSSEVKLLSKQDKLGQALSEMTHRLRDITAIFEAIAGGDCSPNRIDVKGKQDRLAMSINIMLDNRTSVISQINQVSKGDYTVDIVPRSDKDILGIALQKMVKILRDVSLESQKQNWLKTGQNQLNEMMHSECDIVLFSRKIITFLVKYLDAQIGALYLYDEDTNTLELTASYAFNQHKNLNKTFKMGEGLVGQAALDREMISILNVPEDYARINSAIGDAVPRHLIVMPFAYEEALKGIIELGSVQKFEHKVLEFLTIVMENIAIVINSTQSRSRMKKLLKQTQAQAEELISQQEKLRQSNEELERQATTLKANEEKLQLQKEDLQDINLELNRTRHELENKAVELEKSSKYKSEFLSNMSHELRTPMNSMLILSQQLAQNEEGNLTKQQVEAAQIVYNSGNDLLALINEILDLSKIEAGKMSIIIEKVWLSDIANIITTHFTPVIDKKGLALHINIDKMLPDSIMTDHQRLNQILKNLVSNAIKFTAKGSITVDFHRPDPKKYLSRSNLAPHKTLAISVIDTGIGIPKDKQQEIFGVFQQVDGSISRKYGGTGLGLSISRELAKLLDGEIQLTSISGQGSTFTIYIPENFKIDNEMEEKMLPLCPFQEKPLSLGSKKQYNDIYSNINDARNNIEKNDRVILFIEDDLKLAKILYQFGHRNGFKCIHAQDGNMGIKLAEQYIPDAILLDIRFYKNIIDVFKANLKICHIPMHIIPVETLYLDVFKKDVIGFLIKPVTEKQLKVVFSKVVNVKAKEIKQMLIIENEVNLQQCIEKFLKNNKVKVTTVGTGEMGLQNLRTISYDCMVLDLTLPDMSGFSILRKLVEEDISIPLIIVCSQELTLKEHEELQAYTRSIVFKDVKFEEQLRDEITLFLHRIVENLPAQKQNKRNKTSL